MRLIRVVAWIVIVALAAFQAYAQRYAISPDGISYLDLSDAVVGGEWSHLVNLYWSPLYPALIGLARLVSRPGPASEVAVIHALNFIAFVGMFAAFEYMLVSILSLAAVTRRSMLAGPWGLAGAYVLFACFALTMIPMELTTPDLLSGAAVFVAFGALLRLRDGGPHTTRDAVALGAALGVGALAKSFMVPWAIACFATLALATRARGFRATATSVVVWLAVAGPWVIVLSYSAGRFTFGDTGRLTYIWYVNKHDAPSLGGVPPGARTARTEAILPGVGVVGDAPGTDPMWYDPARWNAQLKPHVSLSDQLGTLQIFERFYVQNLTPLLFIALLIAVAPRGRRRKAWWNGWVIYLPALAGVTAYAMVIVTARYIMPFVLGATLVLMATLSLPRRMLPLLALFGIVIPIGLEAMSATTILGLALVTSVVGGMVVGVFVPTRRRVVWVIAVLLGLIVARIIFPPSAPDVLRIGAALLALLFWLAARAAIRRGRSVQFAQRAELSLALLLTIVLVVRLGLRLSQDVVAMQRAGSDTWGNVQWRIAGELASHGITPGTRIALVGPHAESYWARSGRLRIVADVPRIRTQEFWQLSAASRDSLLAEFAGAGAVFAVASVGPESGVPDSTWTAVPFHGWIRRLSP
jgi:hypothetical protein